MLISNRDLDVLNDSITFVFTEERKSDIYRDTVLTNVANFPENINNTSLNKSFAPIKKASEMDNFLLKNGINNIKI